MQLQDQNIIFIFINKIKIKLNRLCHDAVCHGFCKTGNLGWWTENV